MKIVIFAHPAFLSSQSMPLFCRMIYQGVLERGHRAEVWQPRPVFYSIPSPGCLKKWLGYIDQYVIFPLRIWGGLRGAPSDTLFVFADQALGPWVPLVKNRPHVIHVHDFMALRSALGEFPQNPTSWTGRIYQRYIRNGFCQGNNFISVSENTRKDLHRFLPVIPRTSEVVYNGLNYPFQPLPTEVARRILTEVGLTVPDEGFLMHVGGNQWYKNRVGVLALYKAYCETTERPLPLWMIGGKPTPRLSGIADAIPTPGRVLFLHGMGTDVVHAAYALSKVLIFPSLAEGFGWPIAEAMACGCSVLTTGEPPMAEVGGDAAMYIPRMPEKQGLSDWARHGAQSIHELLNEPQAERALRLSRGLKQAERFSIGGAIDAYERIYAEVLNSVLAIQ